jgi:hypothetical protein
MSDREDKLDRALQLITDVRTLMDGWADKLDQARNSDHRSSMEDCRAVMFAAKRAGRKVNDMACETLQLALVLTGEVELYDSLALELGAENAGTMMATVSNVFGEVEP